MKKLSLLLTSLLTLAALVVPAVAHADVNDFTVTSFKADETLSRADPQGELRIVEQINVTFTDSNHGILRAIPDRYKNHSSQIKINKITSDSGAPTRYSTYTSNDNLVLKIGDPNKTITGPQEYTIDYTLRNVISFYKDHDELYWDVNGDQWAQPFTAVSATVHLPDGLRQTQTPACYTGAYGGTASDCAVTNSANTIDVATTKPLTAYQTLTYVAGFQKGYFQPSKWYESVGEYAKGLVGFFVPLVLIGGSGFMYWRLFGRDPRGKGVIVPQYDSPDNMRPLSAGTLLDFKTDNRDISATIIDLAVRRYIKIIETKQDRKLRKDTMSYSLELTNGDVSKLDDNEVTLLKALFDDLTPGSKTDISDRKNKLYTTATTLRKSVKQQLTDGGYFRANSLTSASGKRPAKLVLLVVLFVALDLFAFKGSAIFGTIIGVLIFVLFAIFIDARTQKGVDAKEHLLGLKMYMDVAEKDRLKKLQGPDAEYAANAGEPVKTVDLFEKLLPFAMVLGVEKQWAGQFKDLYKSPPDWYSGNWSTFNAYYLASSLNSGIGAAVNSAFTAPSSSGSSGFSGGGFSGGGGGGGGGGGW